MRSSRLYFLYVLALALVAAAIFGCAGGGSSSTSPPNNPTPLPSGDPSGPPTPAPEAVVITTYKADGSRLGAYANEKTLTPANVKASTFGKKWTYTVDGIIFAQPLYVQDVSINGSNHNVLYVATEHDSVYAFDTDGK